MRLRSLSSRFCLGTIPVNDKEVELSRPVPYTRAMMKITIIGNRLINLNEEEQAMLAGDRVSVNPVLGRAIVVRG